MDFQKGLLKKHQFILKALNIIDNKNKKLHNDFTNGANRKNFEAYTKKKLEINNALNLLQSIDIQLSASFGKKNWAKNILGCQLLKSVSPILIDFLIN